MTRSACIKNDVLIVITVGIVGIVILTFPSRELLVDYGANQRMAFTSTFSLKEHSVDQVKPVSAQTTHQPFPLDSVQVTIRRPYVDLAPTPTLLPWIRF